MQDIGNEGEGVQRGAFSGGVGAEALIFSEATEAGGAVDLGMYMGKGA